jgi:hypothetical protein
MLQDSAAPWSGILAKQTLTSCVNLMHVLKHMLVMHGCTPLELVCSQLHAW